MANPTAITEGSGLKLPLLVSSDGTPRIPAAGDDEALTGGYTAHRAATLVQIARPSTATRTSVAGAVADTLILAANTARKGATIYNDSTVVLYLGLGTTAASTTSYTVQVASQGYYELPFSYAGQVRGIWASATGDARITELT